MNIGILLERKNQVLVSGRHPTSMPASDACDATCAIAFAKSGKWPRAGQKKPPRILATAQNWQHFVDLVQQLYIVSSTLRPENIIIMEPTVPWEVFLEEPPQKEGQVLSAGHQLWLAGLSACPLKSTAGSDLPPDCIGQHHRSNWKSFKMAVDPQRKSVGTS